MKDYSQYTYTELYDMVHHINPFKYPEKIAEVNHQIELRKQAGEIPQLLIPKIHLTKSDILPILKSFGSTLFVLFCMLLLTVSVTHLSTHQGPLDTQTYVIMSQGMISIFLILTLFLASHSRMKIYFPLALLIFDILLILFSTMVLNVNVPSLMIDALPNISSQPMGLIFGFTGLILTGIAKIFERRARKKSTIRTQ